MRADIPRSPGSHEAMTRADWAPAIDIIETAEEFVVKAELTEVGRENIGISVNNGVLEIRGERTFDGDREGLRYHRAERPYGSFARSFALPENVEEDQIHAEYREGMLYLHLPKHREHPSRAIQIPVG